MPTELDELLRRSLRTEAERVEPAGDGLRRIRERTVRPARRRWRWRTPALVLTGAAAVVTALAAAPSVLPSLTAPPPAAGTSAAAPPTPGPTPIPGAGVNDMRTVWPYPTRGDGFRDAPADQDAGRYGDLTKPDQVALRFVASYLGADSLTARSRGAYLAGIRIEVSRGGTPISLVYLVRVRVADDAPYVVVDAAAPDGSLTLDRIPSPRSGAPLVAGGTVAGRTARLDLRLRAPGSDLTLSRIGQPVRGGGWSADLTLPAGTGAAAVTAWTTGPSGVTAFVSRPLGQGVAAGSEN
jgi:hypothetical protein